jgi:hypothetical protein
MADSENLTLQMLKRIDEKLEKLLKRLSSERSWEGSRAAKDAHPLSASAKEIAALTPPGVQQTDAVELLHEDRLR